MIQYPIHYRTLCHEDLNKISAFNMFLAYAYAYNGEYTADNILCAVDQLDHILGVGHLVCHFKSATAHQGIEEFSISKLDELELDMHINPEYSHQGIKEQLLKRLLERADELKHQAHLSSIMVTTTCSHDEIDDIDMFLSFGFYQTDSFIIMKRDLTKPILDVVIDESVDIKRWSMETKEEQLHYLQAEIEGDDYRPMSYARLQWLMHGTEWDTLTAFHKDKVVGSVMTWGLSPIRSATEQIFVVPTWRRRGIARQLVTEALLFLRDQRHKTEATLGVRGDNSAAIKLYKSLDYTLIDIHIELGIRI